MAKLFIFGAFLIAVLAVAQATRFTVTTTITEQQQQCMEQIQPQSFRLRSCQQFLMAPFERQETGEEHIGLQHDKEECCIGLENIRDEQCRCEAVSAVVKDIESMERMAERGPGPQQGHESQMKQALQRIRQTAENLPNQCNIGGPQKCQIQQPSPRFYF